MARTRSRERRGAPEPDSRAIRNANDEELPGLAMERVLAICRNQYELYDRFLKLEALYDPNSWAATGSHLALDLTRARARDGAQVIENVIASNVDSTAGALTAGKVRARFMTSGADYSVQRRARDLTYWAEAFQADHDIDSKCAEKVAEGALKGTGCTWVDVNAYGEIEVAAPLLDDLLVDEGSLQEDGWPMEMFRRIRIDRDELAAQYPEHRAKIRGADPHESRSVYASWFARWLDDGRMQRNQIGVLEGIVRPVGRWGRPGYRPGRHFKIVAGTVIWQDKWEERIFPCSRFLWVPRRGCWYGIGGSERITGHQRRLNKMNWQEDAQMDQIARPTTYVRPADANIGGVLTRSALGTTAVVHGDWPQTIIPKSVSPEQFTRHGQVYEGSFNEFGQNRLSATGMKPPGLDSGAALREYKDQHSERFAPQEGRAEFHVVETVWLGIGAAKRLAEKGGKPPNYMRKTTFGPRPLKWGDVDPKETKLQMAASSKIARTPAGRIQFALEMAQAGVISTDEYRKMIDHPDFERIISLYVAAAENIERVLEDIKDGHYILPTQFMNLQMCVFKGQAEYNLAEENGYPEHVLEGLRAFTLTAAHYIAQQTAAQAGMAPGAAPAGIGPAASPPPMPMGPGAPMALPAGPPGTTPAPAVSIEALAAMPH